MVRPSDYTARLLPRLQNRRLTLHSRFERSANLAASPWLLLALTSPQLGLSPFGLAAQRGLADLLPELTRSGGLLYRNGLFWAGGRPLLEIAPVPPYRTRLEPLCPSPQLSATAFHRLLVETSFGPQQGLAELLSVWEPGESPQDLRSIGSLSAWVQQAAPTIAAFASAPVPQLVQDGRRLIGLGLGLTPSGDDYLLGFVAARIAQGETGEVRWLRLSLAHHAMNATNLISASYLRHGLQGRFSSHLKRLLDLLHSPGCTPEAVKPVIEQVIQVGSTSGRDTLIGVLTGLWRHEQQQGPVSPT